MTYCVEIDEQEVNKIHLKSFYNIIQCGSEG